MGLNSAHVLFPLSWVGLSQDKKQFGFYCLKTVNKHSRVDRDKQGLGNLRRGSMTLFRILASLHMTTVGAGDIFLYLLIDSRQWADPLPKGRKLLSLESAFCL